MSQNSARLSLVFALIGLGPSATAAYVHYRVLADPTYLSFCDVSETFSCTQVYSSRFGTLFGVSGRRLRRDLVRLCHAALDRGLDGRVRRSRRACRRICLPARRSASRSCCTLATRRSSCSKLVCVLCLITYAAVIGLFIVSGAATAIPMMTLPRRVAGDLKVLFSTPVAIALALHLCRRRGVGAWRSSRAKARWPPPPLAAPKPPARPQPPRTPSSNGSWPAPPGCRSSSRPTGAKVLIVKFNDYQCPACGQSYLSYKPILEKYAKSNPGAVKLVLKDYPLNSECNSNMTTVLHAGACDAAVAVRLARQHNRADALEEWLYTNQQNMTPETVRKAAREVGQVTDFEAKYAATLESVKSDIAYGKQLAVRSTPTFFINGVKVEGAWAPQFFDQAIAYELQHGATK